MAKHIHCPKCGSTELDVQCIVAVRLDFKRPEAPQMQQYGGWEYHGENPRVTCAGCSHEGPLLRFEHDAPFVNQTFIELHARADGQKYGVEHNGYSWQSVYPKNEADESDHFEDSAAGRADAIQSVRDFLCRVHGISTEPRFCFEGSEGWLSHYLEVNKDAPDVCEWLRTAKVGDSYLGCDRIA